MSRKRNSTPNLRAELSPMLDEIKRLTIVAMFSDDELFDHLVLKGGNALDVIHRLSTRASIDLDFSMQDDFPEGVDAFGRRVEKALQRTFRSHGYEVFDVRMQQKPNQLSEDVANFWGGYQVEFKLVTQKTYEEVGADISQLRKRGLRLGQGQKFLIDISRFEYTLGKQSKSLDGYTIYVYSPEMILCEKLRAICQQMPEYGPIVKRGRPGSPRARDFVDIYALTDATRINLRSEDTRVMLAEMFKAKRVPLQLLNSISDFREFHRKDFAAVRDTLKAGVQVEPFDFYFDHVLKLVNELEAFWDV